jgi:hypothetical protein
MSPSGQTDASKDRRIRVETSGIELEPASGEVYISNRGRILILRSEAVIDCSDHGSTGRYNFVQRFAVGPIQ